jgi:hypothetical protein
MGKTYCMSSKLHKHSHRVLWPAVAATLWLASCATTSEKLVSTAPQGVDLSGEWRLNVNLSDDPGRIDEPKELPPKMQAPSRNPGGFGRPGMPGNPEGRGPGSIDPGAPPEGRNDLKGGSTGPFDSSAAPSFVPVLYQTSDLPASSSDGGPTPPAGAKRPGVVAQMLNAPDQLTLTQTGSKLVMKGSDGTSEEFTAGEQHTIPFGNTQADRSSGWREGYFVVITKAQKGPSKEDDFALDSEGHLIFATLVTHVKKGPIDFKRVYDRVKK